MIALAAKLRPYIVYVTGNAHYYWYFIAFLHAYGRMGISDNIIINRIYNVSKHAAEAYVMPVNLLSSAGYFESDFFATYGNDISQMSISALRSVLRIGIPKAHSRYSINFRLAVTK